MYKLARRPVSYLRRFAKHQGGRRGHLTTVLPVTDLSAPFSTNVRNVTAVNGFYWATTPEGVAHHDAERLLGSIESAAAPVFGTILDDEFALPRRWPLKNDDRVRLAWWVAAQLLRTQRQRKRLTRLATAQGLAPPSGVRSPADNNPHLAYLTGQLGALAFVIHRRPWAVGFSDACLPTSDVPVVILNGQDADDQLHAAWYWDIVMPLDPHRFLYLPGPGSIEEPGQRVDHRLKLPGWLALFLVQVLYDAADVHIFHHPDHPPPFSLIDADARLPTPWTGDQRDGPGYVFSYDVLVPGVTVERRWLTEHLPPAA